MENFCALEQFFNDFRGYPDNTVLFARHVKGRVVFGFEEYCLGKEGWRETNQTR